LRQSPGIPENVRQPEDRGFGIRAKVLTEIRASEQELAGERRLILLCGRYEGFDQRVVDILQPDEISKRSASTPGQSRPMSAVLKISRR